MFVQKFHASDFPIKYGNIPGGNINERYISSDEETDMLTGLIHNFTNLKHTLFQVN